MLPIILLAAWKRNLSTSTVRRLKGFARVGVYLTCVSAAGMGILAHSANANARQTSMSFGRELAALAPEPEGVTHIKLNGQSIFYAQEFTKDSIHDILGHFQEICEKNPSAFGEVFAKIPKDQFRDPSGKPIPAPPSEIAAGVIKEEGTKEGMLICFTKGEKSGGTFAEAMKRFEQTQDLGEIGRLRYVYVTKGEKENKLMTAWTEDSFRFDKIGLASSTEEAPGSDTALPKPEHARRVINAEVVGTPYGVRVYEVTQSVDEIATFYDNWARTAHFTGIAPDLQNGTRIRAYFREGTQVMVGAFETGGKRYLSISEITPETGAMVQIPNPQ
jgi:hypothetical protein